MTVGKPEFQAFLSAWPPHVQEIARDLRELIFATLPKPMEMIDTSSKVIGYGFSRRYADMLCSLIPSKAGVKLGIAHGASLQDPRGLLAGKGKVHRHIDFRSSADVGRPGVKSLLKSALAAQQARTQRPKE